MNTALIDQVANAIGSADIGAAWSVTDYPDAFVTEKYRRLANAALSAMLGGKRGDAVPQFTDAHLHFYVKPEVYGGTHIADASRACVALAQRLGVSVWFDFNGVSVLARVDDDPCEIIKAWETAIALKRSHAATR